LATDREFQTQVVLGFPGGLAVRSFDFCRQKPTPSIDNDENQMGFLPQRFFAEQKQGKIEA